MRFITIRFAKSVMSTVLQNRHPCEKARQIPVIELDAPLHLAPGRLAAYAESAGRYLHAITERMKRAKTAQSRRTVPA